MEKIRYTAKIEKYGIVDLYKNIYDNIPANEPALFYLKELARNNLWCKYFLKSVARDITWIDFEKEVFEVTQSFRHLFSITSTTAVGFNKLSPNEKFVIEEFNFFLKPINGDIFRATARPFHDQYLVS